ncbi:hypothetical protein LguiB_009121 [Lonicera macranthoides]
MQHTTHVTETDRSNQPTCRNNQLARRKYSSIHRIYADLQIPLTLARLASSFTNLDIFRFLQECDKDWIILPVKVLTL